MTAPNITFGGSIATNYDRALVPILFEEYARTLAGWVDLPADASILEIAAGTGALTRELRERHAGARIVATDLNPMMLEHAERHLEGVPGVSFQTADGLDLPFENESFDAVFCQFGVMFYGDRVHGYREAARVLKPGAHFAFNVWGSLADNPLPRLVHETVRAMFPLDPPAFLSIPFGYHDEQTIREELSRAGLTSVWTEAQRRVSRAQSARSLVEGLVAGTPLGATLDEMGAKADVMANVESALIEAYGDGPIQAPMQAIAVHAQKPV